MSQKTMAIENLPINISGYQSKKTSKSQITTLIQEKVHELTCHKIYRQLTSSDRIECFISYHIFAVWDFADLLNSLQRKIGIALQGQLSDCPREMNILIDKIVFAQNSELYPYGKPNEDFALYLRAMTEIGISPDCLLSFLESKNNLHLLKPKIRELVETNSEIVRLGTMAEIAATLFFGREKLSSQLITSIFKVLKQKGKDCTFLIFYAKRLSQINSRDSDLLALELLDYLCQDETEKARALQTGLEALELREKLWDSALAEIEQMK